MTFFMIIIIIEHYRLRVIVIIINWNHKIKY